MRRSPRHRGLAMVTAIVLIGLTAMTVTEIGLTVAADARRTTQLAEDTQLRQLLLAADEFVLQHLAAGHYQMPVPAQVPASVMIDVHADHSADLEAKLPDRRLSEHLSLTQTDNTWQISQATLN
jgi:hypothetical protein